MKGNTVGSRSNIEKAYIAGFLDGDGSLMLQAKLRRDTKRGYRMMATICLYQDSRHDKTLHWIRKILDAGYISMRNDKITELRIQGFTTVAEILEDLKPFIRFKLLQCEAMILACRILQKGIHKLSQQELFIVLEQIIIIQDENYSAHHKKSREDLLKIFGLTP
jgi:LAGLIDADG endonuclease